MELYTLDTNFRKAELIDTYISAIWTERYTDLGDVVLSVEANLKNRTLLAPGTFLGHPDSEFIMVIESHDVQDGVLKVTGATIDKTFAHRLIWPSLDDYTVNQYITDSWPPGQAMWEVVKRYCAPSGWFDVASGFAYGTLISGNILDSLVMGSKAMEGTFAQFTAKRGPVLDFVKEIGQANNVGWKLTANIFTAELTFTTYYGKDRTSGQSTWPLVRFSPNLDSLANIKELLSNSNYRTVAYAISPDFDPAVEFFGASAYLGKAYAYPGAAEDGTYKHRALLVEVTGLNVDTIPDFATYKSVMDTHAKTALAENNGTKVVDGEIVPDSEFVYGTDYGLGDIIELQDQYGYIQKARITEYIRSKDANGSRAYPTVAVID